MTTAPTLPIMGACDHTSADCPHDEDSIRYLVRADAWQRWLDDNPRAKPAQRACVGRIVGTYTAVANDAQRVESCAGSGSSGLDVTVVPGSYRCTASCPTCGRRVAVARSTGGLRSHKARR